jgi:hypothetical protein
MREAGTNDATAMMADDPMVDDLGDALEGAPDGDAFEQALAADIVRIREAKRVFKRAREALRVFVTRRKPRKASLRTLIKRAEKAGKTVSSVTAPDGTTLRFGETSPDTSIGNEWDEALKKHGPH